MRGAHLCQWRPAVPPPHRGGRRRQLSARGRRPEIFTIVGESGSGKTTLARMARHGVPSAGTIRFKARSFDALAAGVAGLRS